MNNCKVCSLEDHTVFVLNESELWTANLSNAKLFTKKEADDIVKSLQELNPEEIYYVVVMNLISFDQG